MNGDANSLGLRGVWVGALERNETPQGKRRLVLSKFCSGGLQSCCGSAALIITVRWAPPSAATQRCSTISKKMILPSSHFRKSFDAWLHEIPILEDSLVEGHAEITAQDTHTHACPGTVSGLIRF